jgi:cytochrome c oxidase subunit IV
MTTEAMVANRETLEHSDHGRKPYYVVWGVLLAITAIEVALAYQHLQPLRMLTILLALSIVKAALIISWFMHLRYEVTRMRRILMASLCVCLVLMCVFFADAFRILHLGVR